MSIIYCDYTNGDDSTGDGSASNPYKTITQATSGLSGSGNEVRVAKSPDNTNLTGTLSFIAGSTAVVGVGTLFTSELSVGDFIKDNDGNYHEVVTITDDTNLVLYKKYYGDSISGINSQKLGITSTGEASSTTTNVQTVSSNGDVWELNKLKISGGWDLTTETQTGQTYFRQMHSTVTNRYGRGLYLNSKYAIEVEKVSFLRYNYGIYDYYSHNNYYHDFLVLGSGSYAINFYNSNATKVENVSTSSNNNHGTRLYNATNFEFINLVSNSNGNSSGVYFSNAYNCKFTNLVCKYDDRPLYVYKGNGHIINKCVFTGNNTDVYVKTRSLYGEKPCVSIQKYNNVAGDNRCYYEFGVTYRDTTEARSDQCLKYSPSDDHNYISQSFLFPVNSGVGGTITFYLKKNSTFVSNNGVAKACVEFLGSKIVDWADVTPSSADAYESVEISVPASSITEDGVIELKVKAQSYNGDLFLDDINFS